MSTQEAQDLTVRKTVVVECPQEFAFELFTERIHSWWPHESHSPADELPESTTFEPRVGGRLYDRTAKGEEHEWATELEVRFVPEGDGTRVELEHRGWERYGDEAAETYASYNGGWEAVLKPFVAAAGR
jgi:uncharacterized protein YndB with AHSA1/START domain